MRRFLDDFAPSSPTYPRKMLLPPSGLIFPRVICCLWPSILQRRLIAPLWPKEHGGPGLWFDHPTLIFDQEIERSRHTAAPGGQRSPGRPRHLYTSAMRPRRRSFSADPFGRGLVVLRYSRPGSGLGPCDGPAQGRPVRYGYHFVVHSTKTWTRRPSSDWIFCLSARITTLPNRNRPSRSC